jgi:hypothetical protein
LDADFLAAKVRNAADRVRYEKLETADMNPGQNFHRNAAIDAGNLHRGVVQAKIEHAARDRVGSVGARRQRNVADIGEPLGTQQIGDDILRGNTDALDLRQPHGGRLGRCLRSARQRHTRHGGGAGQRRVAQEATSCLHRFHLNPPYSLRLKPSARV